MTKRVPPPSFCTKLKPCDYDAPTAYCPHRECRQREYELVNVLIACKPAADALREIATLMRMGAPKLEPNQFFLMDAWVEATERADELLKVDPRPPV